jgi:hypothetical protein
VGFVDAVGASAMTATSSTSQSRAHLLISMSSTRTGQGNGNFVKVAGPLTSAVRAVLALWPLVLPNIRHSRRASPLPTSTKVVAHSVHNQASPVPVRTSFALRRMSGRGAGCATDDVCSRKDMAVAEGGGHVG